MTITLRTVKGSQLTYAELDGNFTDLNSNKVSLTGTETVSNKTFVNFAETVFSANTGAALTLDIANGSIQSLTANSATVTISLPSAASNTGKSLTVLLAQDATGGRAVTFSSVNWGNYGVPTFNTTASKTTIVSFVSTGTQWLGVVGADGF